LIIGGSGLNLIRGHPVKASTLKLPPDTQNPVAVSTLKLPTVFNLSKPYHRSKTLRKLAMSTPSLTENIALTEQIVTFLDDGVPQTQTLAAPSSDVSTLKESVTDNRGHTIEDILGRPYKVHSGSWSLTDAVGSILCTVRSPASLLAQPNIAAKVAGFLSIRFTTNVKIVLNGNRFQQGRAFLAYYPARVVESGTKEQMEKYLMTTTQRPRVDIDVSTDTDVTLTIPYVSPFLGYNFAENSGEIGTFNLFVYSPLMAVTGPTSLSYTVYMWFTEVEVSYPTYIPQVLGSSSRGSDPAVKEAANPGVGTIASLSGTIGTALKGMIPLYSTVTDLPPWAKALASGSAAAFGFSKPISDHMVAKVESAVFAHTNHSDGGSFARNLGINHNSSVSHMPGFAGQSIDEMDISYLISIPSYYRTSSWSINMATETTLFRIPMGPRTFRTADSTRTVHTPVSYLSEFFRLYRGSFQFHFKLAKTEYHSGRLLVSWQPGNDVNLPVIPPNPNYCYTQVIDIRTCNEFNFTVPFVATTPYKNVTMCTGVLWVQVLNVLQSPDTVSSSLDILCEVCAGEDFEFAQPITPVIYPVAPDKPASGLSKIVVDPIAGNLSDKEDKGWEPQVGGTPERKKKGPQQDSIQTPPRSPSFKRFVASRQDVDTTIMAMYTTEEQIKMAKELEGCDHWNPRKGSMETLAMICTNLFPYPFDDWGNGFTGWDSKGRFGPCGNLEEYVINFHRAVGCSMATFLEDTSGRREISFSASGNQTYARALSIWGPVIPRGTHVWTPQAAGEKVCEKDSSALSPACDPVVPVPISNDVSNSAYCIGERITSLRTLMKRFVPWWQLASQSTDVTDGFRHLLINQVELSSLVVTRMPFSIDYINYFLPMFNYWRGSTRYMFYTNSATNVNSTARVMLTENTGPLMNTAATASFTAANVAKYYLQSYNTAVTHQMGGGLEVEVPFYSRQHVALTDLNTVGNPTARTDIHPDQVLLFKFVSTSKVFIHRAIGEDFSAGFFVGAPITVLKAALPPATNEPGGW